MPGPVCGLPMAIVAPFASRTSTVLNSRFDAFREAEHDPVRRCGDLAADRRVGAFQEGVREGWRCRQQHRQREPGNGPDHLNQLTIGLPRLFGNRSSKYKWHCAITPACEPVCLLPGISASTPTA